MRFLPFLALLAAATTARSADGPRPNFILISIDDMGYADIAPFGSTLNRTPNLDRMAAEGRKLTSFYAAPVCSPSRAALMTGSYPKRCLPIPHVLFPGDGVGLSPDEVTVAEVLKDAGYATSIVGKWHLGDQAEWLPNRQGFDSWFGLPYSNDMGPPEDGTRSDLGKPLPAPKPDARGKGQPPLPLMRDGHVVKLVGPDEQQSLVEIYTDEAVSQIRKNKDRPFFLYLAHNAVHFPVYPGKKFAGKSPNGIFSDWVEESDASVGRVLDTVRELGLAERTLVLFTSDNGGTPRSVNAPLRGHKNSTWEGGMRVPTIAWWPQTIPAGTASDAVTGMMDVLPTFAAIAGARLPEGRKLDGQDIRTVLTGDGTGHDVFYYYRGLRLEGVRQGEWKLRRPAGKGPPRGDANADAAGDWLDVDAKPALYHLTADIGESTDVAAAHPEIVAKLKALVLAMQGDLGLDGAAQGSRPLGKSGHPAAIMNHDGIPRPDAAGK